MKKYTSTYPKHFFYDKQENFVVAQAPNIPILLWVLSQVSLFITPDGQLHDGLKLVSSAILFTWAYMEITTGVNYFRRCLGLIVMGWVLVGFFS